MSRVTGPPDLQVIVEQLLRAHAQRTPWTVRAQWLPQAGFGILHAAGLPRSRARAVNVMIRRTARAWRKAKEPIGDEEVAATAARLLI